MSSLASTVPVAQPTGAPRSPRRWGVRIVVATVLFVLLGAWRVASYYPPLPNPLALTLTLEPGVAGRSDPLIASGGVGQADFLAVRFDDRDTVRFLYDSWGIPGLESTPVSLAPNRKLALEVTLPALDQIHGSTAPDTKLLRVVVDGKVVLESKVHRYVRAPDRIFLGTNPIGGTSCGANLHGGIAIGGRSARGGASTIFPFRHRLKDWLTRLPWQAVSLWLATFILAANVHRARSVPHWLRRGREWLSVHRCFAVTATLCTLVFTWLVTLGSFRFNHGEVFGSFYDYQATSFLQGRLDVPEDAIEGEAFEARGKLYGYFGPTPALLRLPFAVTGFAFGKLSRAFMVIYYVAGLAAAYLLLREALRFTQSPGEVGRHPAPTRLTTIVIVVSAGLGSTVFFLGSRALIFHEAILGGITLALWSSWCSLRFLRLPTSRYWIGALICGILSVHTRPPTGLFALTLLGCVALTTLRRSPARAIAIGCLCLAGQLSLNGLAWLKFRTFDAAPLKISRPYTEPGRLERIDSKSFHLVNLPYNFDAYVLFPNFRFAKNFPWVYLISDQQRRSFPRAKIDLPDHTLAVPYSMPSLFWTALLGGVVALFGVASMRPALLCVWAAVIPMSLALFAAIATAQRYTGDFVPFLVVAAALGLGGLDTTRIALRRLLRGTAVLLTGVAVVVTFAITLHYQRAVIWGVPDGVRVEYEQARQRIDRWFNVPPPPKT